MTSRFIQVISNLDSLVHDFKDLTKRVPTEIAVPKSDFYELNCNLQGQDSAKFNDRSTLIAYKFEDVGFIKIISGSGIYPRLR